MQSVDAADEIVCDSHHDIQELDLTLAKNGRNQMRNFDFRRIRDEM